MLILIFPLIQRREKSSSLWQLLVSNVLEGIMGIIKHFPSLSFLEINQMSILFELLWDTFVINETLSGLVTREVLAELQNKRSERKRRSTANPHFLYGNILEQVIIINIFNSSLLIFFHLFFYEHSLYLFFLCKHVHVNILFLLCRSVNEQITLQRVHQWKPLLYLVAQEKPM